jgi:hypothetical protein
VRKIQGRSFNELLIAVAIVLSIAAIAIPNLLLSGHQSCAKKPASVAWAY